MVLTLDRGTIQGRSSTIQGRSWSELDVGRRSFRVVYVRVRPSRVELRCYLRTSVALDCGFEFQCARDDDDDGGA
jgi:hypothetical protein